MNEQKIKKVINKLSQNLIYAIKCICRSIVSVYNQKGRNFPTKVSYNFLKVVKYIFNTIVMGIIIGVVVTYLLSTPVLSITRTKIDYRDSQIELTYENKGESEAENVNVKYIYGPLNMNEKHNFTANKVKEYIYNKSDNQHNARIGDVYTLTMKNIKFTEAPIFFLIYFSYDDTSEIRKYINKLIKINTYEFFFWGAVNSKNRQTSFIPIEGKVAKESRNDLQKWIKDK